MKGAVSVDAHAFFNPVLERWTCPRYLMKEMESMIYVHGLHDSSHLADSVHCTVQLSGYSLLVLEIWSPGLAGMHRPVSVIDTYAFSTVNSTSI